MLTLFSLGLRISSSARRFVNNLWSEVNHHVYFYSESEQSPANFSGNNMTSLEKDFRDACRSLSNKVASSASTLKRSATVASVPTRKSVQAKPNHQRRPPSLMALIRKRNIYQWYLNLLIAHHSTYRRPPTSNLDPWWRQSPQLRYSFSQEYWCKYPWI